MTPDNCTDYYEEAAYFEYTHDSYEYPDEDVDHVLSKLSLATTNAVVRRAERDVKYLRPRISLKTLEELLLDAGLLKYGETSPYMDALYEYYLRCYKAEETLYMDPSDAGLSMTLSKRNR